MAYDQQLADANRMLNDSGARLYTLEAEHERLQAAYDALFAERERLRLALFEARPYVPDHHGPVQARIAEALAPIDGVDR